MGLWSSVELRNVLGKCPCDLSCPVRTEVEEDQAVAILNRRRWLAGIIHNRGWGDELVSDALVLRLKYSRQRVTPRTTFTVAEQPVGLPGSLPTFITIHSVVASKHRPDLADIVCP